MPNFVTLSASHVVNLRTDVGITQQELARRADLSRTTVRQAESGQRISFRTAKKIASGLEVDLDQLGVGQEFKPRTEFEEDLYDLATKAGAVEESETLFERIEAAVDKMERTMYAETMLNRAHFPVCGFVQVAYVLAQLLSRFGQLCEEGNGAVKNGGYGLLVVELVATTARQLVQDNYDKDLFAILVETLHCSNPPGEEGPNHPEHGATA